MHNIYLKNTFLFFVQTELDASTTSSCFESNTSERRSFELDDEIDCHVSNEGI